MFYRRTDILIQKIQLYDIFSLSTIYNMIKISNQRLKDTNKLRDFIRQEILDFSTPLIDSMMKYQCFDFNFLTVLFKFLILEEISLNPKYFDDVTIKRKYEHVSKGLFMPQRIYPLSEFLKQIEKPQTSKARTFFGVTILNLGSGHYLQMSTENNDLIFGSCPYPFDIYPKKADGNNYLIKHYYELRSQELVFCTIPSNYNNFLGTFRPKLASTNPNSPARRITITLYDAKDITKGYLIKANNHNVYLCSGSKFEPSVQLKKTIDDNENQYPYFTWKFQSLERHNL